MCGIAGIWRLPGSDPADIGRIGRMSSQLEHRGPNDFGYLMADTPHGKASVGQNLEAPFVPDLVLASRRLSILDLSPQGRQPIANETDDVFVVFNGAIHNYVELRQELEGFGHVFRSNTDTEVIVHAYEQWGADCAKRFNGMWAYAIWDLKQERLVCSRDRFGIKPFCIARHGGAFFFASEPKALIGAGVPAIPNPNFVHQFVSYSVPAMGDETAFDGIVHVPAGHNLIVSRSGECLSRYWSYTDQSQTYDFSNPEEAFRDLFDDAVRLRLRSDVPIAVLLSGGLDSSSIAVRAAKQMSDGKLEAFTASFPGYYIDERRHAELVADHGGLNFNVVEYREEDLIEDTRSVTWALDTPPAMNQTIARWRLLESVSASARIVLDGQGGDEIFGGYPDRYMKPYCRSELDSLTPANLHRRLPRYLAARIESKRPLLDNLKWQRQSNQRFDPSTLLSSDFPDRKPLENHMGRLPGFDHPSKLQTILWRDHSFTIIPHVVHFADAISMAHSIESRPPFLDHRLVEFMYGLPFDQMIRGGETKYLLRRSLAADLPTEICRRRDKKGLNPPVEKWARANMDRHIRPFLMSQRTRDRGLFNQPALDQCLQEAMVDQRSSPVALRCYSLEQWFRLFVDGDGYDGAGIPNNANANSNPRAATA